MFGIYKYVYDGEIIYIGKSDNSILNRVNGHAKEEKFKPYLDKAIIYYTVYENAAQTDFYESYFINKYKPKLNVAKMFDGNIGVDIPEPEWNLLSELKEMEKANKALKKPKKLGIKWYEHRVKEIEELKRRNNNLDWLESFLPRFYGMYNIEFSVEYTNENLKMYTRLMEVFSFVEEGVYGGFNLGTSIAVNKEKKIIRVSSMTSHLKELDFWNNYEVILHKTKDDHLKEISKLICKIKEAGYEYNE